MLLRQLIRMALGDFFTVCALDGCHRVPPCNAQQGAGLLEVDWRGRRVADVTPYPAGVTVENVFADADRHANVVNRILAAVAAGFAWSTFELGGMAQANGHFQRRGWPDAMAEPECQPGKRRQRFRCFALLEAADGLASLALGQP